MLSIKRFYIYLVACLIITWFWIVFQLNYQGDAQIVVCPSRLIFHISCPGCGITRAVVKMLRGDVVGALMMNPNVILAISFMMLTPFCLLWDAIMNKRWAYKCWLFYEKAFQNKFVIVSFLAIEVLIMIHNMVNDI